MKVDGQSDSFSPPRSSLVGWHRPTPEPYLLTYCITRMRSVTFSPCLSSSPSPPPPPVASYLEIMTSIRFNIKQGEKGECSEWSWRRKSVDELLLSVSICCPAVSACEGRGLATQSGGSGRRARVCFDSSWPAVNGRADTRPRRERWPECILAPWTRPLRRNFHLKVSQPTECKNGAGHTVASCLEDQNVFRRLQLCCRIFSIRSLHTNVQLIWKELTKMPQEVVAPFLFFFSLANSPHFAGKLPIQSCPDSTFCFLSCQSLLLRFF